MDAGDIFTIDGTKLYEIESIQSDTQLTLRTPYTGANVTAGAYAIIPNFSVQPAAKILGKNLLLINKWLVREQELTEWQSKPYNATTPATVSIQAWDGSSVDYKSLPQIIGELYGVSSWNNLQDKPANLISWAEINPVGAFDWAKITNKSANIIAWDAIAPSSKQDALTFHLTFAQGGTGATTAADARAALGLTDAGTIAFTGAKKGFLRDDGSWSNTLEYQSLRLSGWGTAAQDGVLHFGSNENYFAKQGARFNFVIDGGISAWLDTNGRIWTTGNLTPSNYVLKAGDTMSGALTINSNVTAQNVYSTSGNFLSTGLNAVLANSGADGGAVFLRPRGINSESAQAYLDQTGGFNLAGVGDALLIQRTKITPALGQYVGGLHVGDLATLTGNASFRAGSAWTSSNKETYYALRMTAPNETTVGSDDIQFCRRRIRADFTTGAGAAGLGRMYFQSSTTDGVTNISMIPNGTSNTAVVGVFNRSDTSQPASFGQLSVNDSAVRLVSGTLNGGASLPLILQTESVDRVLIYNAFTAIVNSLSVNSGSSPAAPLDVTVQGAATNGGARMLMRMNGPASLDFVNGANTAYVPGRIQGQTLTLTANYSMVSGPMAVNSTGAPVGSLDIAFQWQDHACLSVRLVEVPLRLPLTSLIRQTAPTLWLHSGFYDYAGGFYNECCWQSYLMGSSRHIYMFDDNGDVPVLDIVAGVGAVNDRNSVLVNRNANGNLQLWSKNGGNKFTLHDKSNFENTSVRVTYNIPNGTSDGARYSAGHLELLTTNQTYPAIGFHRQGADAVALYYTGGQIGDGSQPLAVASITVQLVAFQLFRFLRALCGCWVVVSKVLLLWTKWLLLPLVLTVVA
ncbi:tail fiber domain-containing protein [Xanthomonas phage JGB6]|nr:tail fiber domain-containing protein [Xanthomonas phage JGB6]